MLDCQHNEEWHNVFSWQTGKKKKKTTWEEKKHKS